MDRRALFFFGAAIVAGVLAPLTEAEHRWVPIGLSIVYLVLSVASFADARTRAKMS